LYLQNYITLKIEFFYMFLAQWEHHQTVRTYLVHTYRLTIIPQYNCVNTKTVHLLVH